MKPDHSFERAVLRDVVDRQLLRPGERTLVAVSGGPDSTALLLVLHAISRSGAVPLDLAVVHLNHRLRGAASDRDERAVAALAGSLGLESFIEDATDLEPDAANLEATARARRYELFTRIASEWSASAVAVGHTRDDQAETVLHRLARGAGLTSLAAMEWRRADAVTRPLLGRRRAECRAYLDALGIVAAEDESNADLRFTRNRLRHELLPLLDRHLGVDMTERLADLAAELRVETTLAARALSPLLESAAWSDSGGESGLAVWAVHVAAEGAGRLVHAWLARSGVRASRAQVAQIVRVARGPEPGASVDISESTRVVRRYGELLLTGRPNVSTTAASLGVPDRIELATGWRLEACSESAQDWLRGGLAGTRASANVRTDPTFASNLHEVCLDAAAIQEPLHVRSAVPGDRIQLSAGHRKLSDLFIDLRVPRDQRVSLPVVLCGDDAVLWIPGVARSVHALPTERTTRILVLRAHGP